MNVLFPKLKFNWLHSGDFAEKSVITVYIVFFANVKRVENTKKLFVPFTKFASHATNSFCGVQESSRHFTILAV